MPTASGGEWSPQSAAPDARLAPDQRPARAQRRDRRHGRVAGDHQRGETRDRSARCSPTRRGARTRAARRYLLVRPARLQPLRREAGRRAHARAGSAATPARRAPASPAAARPTSTPTRSSSSSPRRCCIGSTRRELADGGRAAAATRARTRALAAGGRAGARRSSTSSPPPTASGEITMDEWMAARKPIEQRLTAARKQLAQASPAPARSTGYVGNGDGAARRLGRARPQPAARDRRRRPRPRRRRPRPPRLQPLRRVARSRPVWRALSQVAPRPSPSASGSDSLTGSLGPGRSARPTPPRGPLARQFHCAQQAGGPRHPSTLDDSQTRSGCATHVAGGALDHVLGRAAVALDLGRLEALRDLVAMQARQPALVLESGRRSGPGSGRPAAPPPSAPEPTGSPPSSLMCTKPWPQARSISLRGTKRPTAKCACRPCPPGCHCGTHTYGNGPASEPRAQLAEERRPDRRAAAAGRGSPRPR